MPSSTNFVFLAEQVFVADPKTTQFLNRAFANDDGGKLDKVLETLAGGLWPQVA